MGKKTYHLAPQFGPFGQITLSEIWSETISVGQKDLQRKNPPKNRVVLLTFPPSN